MSGGEWTASLVAALNEAGIPLDNHAFIGRLARGIGCAEYLARTNTSKPHVLARRRDGHRDLEIYSGYTVGLLSEEGAIRAAEPGAVSYPATTPKGTWLVEHPVNGSAARTGDSFGHAA